MAGNNGGPWGGGGNNGGDDKRGGGGKRPGQDGPQIPELEEIVEEERTKAAGRARVARDSLDLGDIELKEAEQKALADMALADFAAAEGIEIEPKAAAEGEASESAEKPGASSGTMGPGVSE